eukprot:CAMPEP_0182435770 /NCGR_PEP_ID=MMETSP1167-20130531/77547_1 /TAXON_ID=2988 /ORGANISM="Mallomonas Sp, Strain CCMP3275" /LENGTH=527 /DNA_ID=CAMNT_0024627177 /DNA_START=336 /DNA_END=1919 /DNA_ORIENTATION=+
MKQVWENFHKGFGKFMELRESVRMAMEDNARKVFDRYVQMQKALLSMDGLLRGIKILLGRCSIHVRYNKQLHPTYAMSYRSLRYQQFRVHQSHRISCAHLAYRSSNYPLFERWEGRYFDKDVCLLARRFMKIEVNIKRQDYDRFRRTEAQITAETKRLENLKFTGSRAKLMAMTAHLRKLRSIQADHLYSNLDAMYDENDENKEMNGNVFKGKPMLHIKKRRRNSITAPENMYRRVCNMRTHVIVKNFHRRRRSLPNQLRDLLVISTPPFSYIESIESSLELFYYRRRLLQEFTDPDYNFMWLESVGAEKRQKIKETLKSCFLTPRLPRETMQRLLQPERRHTIAEPERVLRLLRVMFDTRSKFAELRAYALAEDLPLRQRSYDPNEILDDEEGVTERLGYQYEPPLIPPLMTDLDADQVQIEKRLVKCKWYMDFRDTLKNGKTSPKRKPKPPPPPPAQRPVRKKAVIWQEHTTEEGHIYYYQEASGESSWDAPRGPNVQIKRMHLDPDSGHWYWYNETTGETNWLQ